LYFVARHFGALDLCKGENLSKNAPGAPGEVPVGNLNPVRGDGGDFHCDSNRRMKIATEIIKMGGLSPCYFIVTAR